MPGWSTNGVNNPTKIHGPDSAHCWGFGGWHYPIVGRYCIYSSAETTTEQVKENRELGSFGPRRMNAKSSSKRLYETVLLGGGDPRRTTETCVLFLYIYCKELGETQVVILI